MAQLLRVQNFMLSRDGFGAGLNQCFERPFGDADQPAPCSLGRRDGELGEPQRARR